MSSFEEFHKKWKEKNNITESSPYKKTSNEEIAKAASEYIDKLHEQNRQNTWNQVPNNILKGASSTWNVIQNVAYDNLNKFSTDEFVKNYTNSIANVYNKSNYSKQKTNNFLGNIGKIIENTWLGGLNGIKNFQQSLNQAITNTEINKTKMFENSIPSKYKEEYEKTKKENDFLSLMSSDNLKKEQEESTKKLQEEKNENTEKINQNIEKIDNPIMKKVAELSPSVGQMIPSFVPGIGTIYASGSAKGSYYDDAKQRGMNDDEANTYSAIMGTVEGLTEMIGVENLSKAGKTAKTLISRTGKEITKEGIKQIGKSSIKTALKEYGIGIADNVMQEALIEPIQEVVASTVGGKDKANWDNIGQRMLQSGIDGGLVGIITGGGNLGIQSCVGFIDKVRNGQKPTQQELKKAVQDASKEVDVQKMIVDSTQQVINKYKSSINNEVNNIKQNNENMSNFMQSAQNEQPNVQNYQYVKSDNVKIDSLRQDVSKYFDNSEKTQNFVNMLEKIIQDKDVEIRLDDTLVDNNGNVVNGKYQNGVITINPNSTRAGEFIAIHELTHAIGTKDMIDIVENYRKSNTEFNTAVQDLLKSYNQTEITEEALADVSAQLFGNQEFINNLSQTNPSIFKKIYNEIKYLWHQFRGYKNQNQFIEDLQYKWEQAYKSNNELNNTTNYSIQTDNNGNRYVKVDTDQDIFEGINEKDYNKIAKMYMQDYLEGKTKLAENDTVKIGNKGISKYTNPKQQTRYMNEKMQLSTELKNVLEVAEKVNSSLPTKDTSKFPNWEYYKVDFEIGGKNFEGLINIGIDKKGNKHFYEINKIRITSNSYVSTSKSSNTDSINNSILPTQENVNSNTQKYFMQESENNSGSFNLKEKQLEIIQKNNPMQDDYHTGIRNIEDIKTFEETLQDSDWVDYDEFNPDYTRSMAEDAIKTGKITVYSSYPIEQGTFISPSYMEAESYSEDGKVYSKEVNLNDVAWIDPTQGQYAKVESNKYSKQNKNWQEYLDNNFKSEGTRTNLQDINLPTKEKMQKSSKALNLPKETIRSNITQQGSNFPMNENMKQRKHYKSIMESSYTSKEAKSIAKELMGTDTYVPESNKKQLARADERISISGADSELNSLMSRSMTGGNIKADDIAVGERLIQYYSKSGNKAKLQEAIQATAMAGTSAGQTVQAMSLLNHQTPEGQAIWIQRSVEKMNNDLRKTRGEKAQQFDLTPEMIDKIVNSQNIEELQNNVNEVYEELGQQVSKTIWQKIDSWRYFSMLFNIRTHLRNVVGNTAMGVTQKVKNKTAGIIEGVVSKISPEMERTHTIVPASKEVKQFAKNDIANVADRLGLNDNKYNPKSRLENSMRTFKSDIMENTVGKIFNFNDKALEAEDGFGLKMAYKNALTEYMTANKLTPENITDSQLSKARNYAVEQAKEATFHQESKVASLLNQLSNKNKFAKATMDATLPFKKTPINVAKSGLEYSPVGLVKSIVYDSVELRKGNITANKYIDNISKGLTGTGIALVGYALADMGMLKASGGDDDKKEKYDEAMGNQTYSITIGDKTYSLDWLAPSGIPLFIGAELKQIVNSKSEKKTSSTDSNSNYNQILETGSNLLNAFSNAMNPMAEMSMLSGLTSALQSYEQGSSQMFAELGTNAVKSYVNQYVPTVLGQVAKTADDYERSTTSTKTGALPKAIDQTKNQIMSKIPGLRQMLPVKTDIWGNDIKQNENIVARTFENGVLPWTEKKVESNKVNDSLNDLYNKTGESSIYPKTIDKNFTLNGENYRLTSEEFSKYQKNYGQTSYNLINSLVSSKEYKNMTNLQKQKAIEEIYSYAKEKNKVDYAKKVKKEIETSTLYKTMQDLKNNGGNQSEYLNYIARIEGLKKDKEKNELLSSSNYSNKTKSIIYKNTTGSEDDLYNNILSKYDININEYLNYKLQEFESDKEDDGTLQGKSISGSKKKKVNEYVNSMDITLQQKIAIIGTQYKLNRNEQKDLYNYINNIPNQTKDEKLEIFKKYSKNFTIYQDGTISFK